MLITVLQFRFSGSVYIFNVRSFLPEKGKLQKVSKTATLILCLVGVIIGAKLSGFVCDFFVVYC